MGGEGWRPGLGFSVLEEFMCSPAGDFRISSEERAD